MHDMVFAGFCFLISHTEQYTGQTGTNRLAQVMGLQNARVYKLSYLVILFLCFVKEGIHR